MKLLIKRLLSLLPTKLPVGMTEFDQFSNDIIELSGQYADLDSMRFAIASMLIHAPAHSGALSKHYFVVRLRKSACNQVASQVFQTIKSEQDAKQKAASEAAKLQQAADTTAETTVSGKIKGLEVN